MVLPCSNVEPGSLYPEEVSAQVGELACNICFIAHPRCPYCPCALATGHAKAILRYVTCVAFGRAIVELFLYLYFAPQCALVTDQSDVQSMKVDGQPFIMHPCQPKLLFVRFLECNARSWPAHCPMLKLNPLVSYRRSWPPCWPMLSATRGRKCARPSSQCRLTSTTSSGTSLRMPASWQVSGGRQLVPLVLVALIVSARFQSPCLQSWPVSDGERSVVLCYQCTSFTPAMYLLLPKVST